MGPNESKIGRITEKHQHSAMYVYPQDITTSYAVSSGAVAGNPGSTGTIISGGTLTEEYDIHYVFSLGLPSNCQFRLRFYVGATPRFIGETEVIRASNFETGGNSPIITGDSHQLLDPSEDLKVDAICSAAGPIALNFKIGLHKY